MVTCFVFADVEFKAETLDTGSDAGHFEQATGQLNELGFDDGFGHKGGCAVGGFPFASDCLDDVGVGEKHLNQRVAGCETLAFGGGYEACDCVLEACGCAGGGEEAGTLGDLKGGLRVAGLDDFTDKLVAAHVTIAGDFAESAFELEY